MKKALVIFLIFINLFIVFLVNRYQHFLVQAKMEIALNREADIIKLRFEHQINREISNTEYIKTLFKLHRETTPEEFAMFAGDLLNINPSIQALQFADNSTKVIYVYPSIGNEVTISNPMILLDDPERGVYVKTAIKERRMTVQPPFELRQGGLGIVARNPIFINDEFQGLGIAVIKVDNIISDCFNKNDRANYQLRLLDDSGRIFFDSCNVYDCIDEKLQIVEREILFGHSSWSMQLIMHDAIIKATYRSGSLIIALTIVVLVLSLILIYIYANRSNLLKAEVDKQILKINEAETRFSFLIENSKAGYFELSPDDEFIRVNKAWLDMHGYESEEEVIGRHFSLTQIPEDLDNASEVVDSVHEGPGDIDGEFSRLCKDGTVKYHTYTAVPLSKNGEYAGLVGFIFDITERKKAEAEKDFLMKELNHRVKNNLLMISSLIALKEMSLGGDVDLSDIINQIRSIQLIHEKLYLTGNVSNVSVKDYFRDLLESIFSSFTEIPVQIKADIENITLGVKDAVNIGLLINEIATNAIKHAYIGRSEGWFSIEFSLDSASKEYILKLSNSGVVFPEDVKLDNPSTLGLRLISKLTKQIYGTIELRKKPETLFIIKFPV